MSELVGPTWRGHMTAFPAYVWAVAGVLLAGLAAGIDDWRVLTVVFGVVSLPALGIIWYVSFNVPLGLNVSQSPVLCMFHINGVTDNLTQF